MVLRSTRDKSVTADGATAVIDGIPVGGGSFVPEEMPKLDCKTLSGDYSERCESVLRAFFDFDVTGVAELLDDDIAPVVKLDDDLFVLESWHGKTCSVEDTALAVLPRLLDRAKAHKGDTSKTLLLVAASGGMGGAALESFNGMIGAELCAFYPPRGLSEYERRAVVTADGANIDVVEIIGGEDAALNAVRSALSDDGLKRGLAENNITLSTVADNIGVTAAYIALYYSAYCDLVDSGEIACGETVDFAVPAEYAHCALAGAYARGMGLPVNRIVCAFENEHTFARLEGVAGIELKRVSHDDIEQAAFDMFDEYGYVLDPVSASAYAACTNRARPTIVLSASCPYKCASEVLDLIGESDSGDAAELLEDLTAMEVPDRIKEVSTKVERRTKELKPDEVVQYLRTEYIENSSRGK